MKNTKKYLYLLISVILTFLFVNSTNAIEYNNVVGTYTIKCSDYPTSQTLTLTVNGYSATISCDPPPTGAVSYSPADWTTGDVVVNVVCSDKGTGCEKDTYTKTVSDNGSGYITISDKEGHTANIPYNVKNIDRTPPVGEVIYSPSGWTKENVTVTIKCSDAGVGCKEDKYTKIIDKNEKSFIEISDKLGNKVNIPYEVKNIDREPPTGVVSYSPSTDVWTSQVIVTIKCNDVGVGCEKDTYTKIIIESGKYFVEISDKLGNKVNVEYEVKNIDKEDPYLETDVNIPDTKKAGEGNIHIVGTIFDDKSVGDTIDLYGDNYPINYKIVFDGPYKVVSGKTYGGDLSVPVGSEKIEDSGSVINNTILDKTYNITTAGLYNYMLTLTDKSGRTYVTGKTITIYPAELDGIKSLINDKSNSTGDKYANNLDDYEFELTLKDKYGNYIFGKSLNSIEQTCENQSLGCEKIYLDMVDKTDEVGTEIFALGTSTSSAGVIGFKIKAYTPGVFSQYFNVELNDWGDDYKDNSQEVSKYLGTPSTTSVFLTPVVINKIEATNDDGADNWTAQPDIGKDQKYRITLTNTGRLNNGSVTSISDGKLDMTSATIDQKVEGHFWAEFGVVNENFGSDITAKNLSFTGRIDVRDGALSGPKVGASNLPVSYVFTSNNKRTRYTLEPVELANSCNKSTLGVKVQGSIQSDGKGSLTGQQENFSDLTTSTMRNSVRKEAYTLIKNMISGQVVNGVKYVEGENIEIQGDQGDYETLIVKDGNVVITGDLNPSNSKILGIIVLRDGYNVVTDWEKSGNVYVGNDVKKINAVIYADGALISAKSNGEDYDDGQLLEQLELNGSLFTRNTIGGAVAGSTSRTLPGGTRTTDYELASRYDLNYVRKTPICGPDDYAFLIKYDPRIQTNPPKGFKIN